MAAVNPPFVIQASSHPADAFRRLVRATRPSPGVRLPTDLAVTANGTPNMTVNLAAGEAIIDGTQNVTNQGSYESLNDATVSQTIAASDATNPRIDLVVAQVQDASYSGAINAWTPAVVTGTPAPSPVVPAAPANSLILAQVAVAANVTTIVAGNITDRRTYLWQVIQPGSTGLHIRNSTNARDNLYMDDNGYLFPQGTISIPPSFGGTLAPSSYGTVPVKIDERSLNATAASVLFPASGSLPTGFRELVVKWKSRSDQAGFQAVLMQLNGDVGANYFSSWGEVNGSTATSFASLGATGATVGYVPNTTSANWGIGKIELPDPFNAAQQKLFLLQWLRFDGGGAGQVLNDYGGGEWANTSAGITSIRLLPAAGLFVAGSLFTLWGYP